MYKSGLRLELAPDAAEALLANYLSQAAPEVVDLHSTYFDTEELHLRQAGHALRVRRMQDMWVQAVKWGGASPTMYIRRLNGPEPVLERGNPALAVLKGSDLQPHFEVRIERRIWTLTDAVSKITVVLDRGEIAADSGTVPVCDLTLELRQGESEDLYALARQLGESVPVRLSVLSRTDQGYELREGPHTAFKAAGVQLDESMTAAEAFQVIALACVRQYRQNESLLLAGGGKDSLHQSRVAIRRLRSALTLFRPVVGKSVRAGLGEELRALAEQIGQARDLDVLLESLPEGNVHRTVSQLRDEAYTKVLDVLNSQRVRWLLIDTVQWITTGPWLSATEPGNMRDLPVGEFASDALDRLYRKLRKQGKGFRDLSDDDRHELRKTAKKMRYGTEFLSSLYNRTREKRRRTKFISALETLQDQLGALNDLATALPALERIGIAEEPDVQELLTPERKAGLLNEADSGYRKLMALEPFWRKA